MIDNIEVPQPEQLYSAQDKELIQQLQNACHALNVLAREVDSRNYRVEITLKPTDGTTVPRVIVRCWQAMF